MQSKYQFVIEQNFLNFKYTKKNNKKNVEFASSVDPDEAAH